MSLDVTRWVRAWRDGSKADHGLVIWMPEEEPGLLPSMSDPGTPTLRVIQRPLPKP